MTDVICSHSLKSTDNTLLCREHLEMEYNLRLPLTRILNSVSVHKEDTLSYNITRSTRHSQIYLVHNW